MTVLHNTAGSLQPHGRVLAVGICQSLDSAKVKANDNKVVDRGLGVICRKQKPRVAARTSSFKLLLFLLYFRTTGMYKDMDYTR